MISLNYYKVKKKLKNFTEKDLAFELPKVSKYLLLDLSISKDEASAILDSVMERPATPRIWSIARAYKNIMVGRG